MFNHSQFVDPKTFKMDSYEKIKDEVVGQLTLVLPVCLSFVFRKSIDIVSVIFVGHLGARYLSASGLATVTANVTGNSMIIGFAGALSTLCSQLHGMKTKNDYAVNVLLPRSIVIIISVINIPVSIIWLEANNILQFLGQEKQLSYDAGVFIKWLIPGLWALTCSMCIQNWLHSQSKTKFVLFVTIFVALIHPIFCYILITYYNYGYIGAAIASSLSKCLELFLLCICMYFKSSFTMIWSMEALFQEWIPFLKLGLPGLLMMSEWWASEIIIFLSGLLSEPDIKVSTMSIYQNTLSICFMIPAAIHVVSVTRVGNALGENLYSKASLAAKISPSLACIISLLIAMLLFTFQKSWCLLFTTDPEVTMLLCTIFPILVIYTVADGIQSSLTGVLKGLGKQNIAGPIVIFSYYVVGLPASVLLAFPCNGYGWNMDLTGLVIGTTIGTYIHMLLFSIVVSRTEWQDEAKNIYHRTKLTSSLAEITQQIVIIKQYLKDKNMSTRSIIHPLITEKENSNKFDRMLQRDYTPATTVLTSSNISSSTSIVDDSLERGFSHNEYTTIPLVTSDDNKELYNKDNIEAMNVYDESLKTNIHIPIYCHKEEKSSVNNIDNNIGIEKQSLPTCTSITSSVPSSSSYMQSTTGIDDKSDTFTYFDLRNLEQQQLSIQAELYTYDENGSIYAVCEALGFMSLYTYIHNRLYFLFCNSRRMSDGTIGMGVNDMSEQSMMMLDRKRTLSHDTDEPNDSHNIYPITQNIQHTTSPLSSSSSTTTGNLSWISRMIYPIKLLLISLQGTRSSSIKGGDRGGKGTNYALVNSYTDVLDEFNLDDSSSSLSGRQ